MEIEIEDFGDFVDKLFEVRGGDLELVFTTARYEDAVFNLACDEGYSRLSLRGRSATRLVDSSIDVCAAEISVEELLFDTPVIFNPLFSARVNNGIVIERCAWLGAYLEEQPGLSVIHIEPRSAATRLLLSDSWLIDNMTNEGHHIIGFRTPVSAAITSMTFARTAFIDNRSDYVIGALMADFVLLRDCFVWVRDPKTIFLGARTKGASISFSGGTFIVPKLGQIVTQWASDSVPGDFKPALFDNCRIYVTEDESVPDGIQLEDTTIQKIDPLPDDKFSSWLESQKEEALTGKSPNPGLIRHTLDLN